MATREQKIKVYQLLEELRSVGLKIIDIRTDNEEIELLKKREDVLISEFLSLNEEEVLVLRRIADGELRKDDSKESERIVMHAGVMLVAVLDAHKRNNDVFDFSAFSDVSEAEYGIDEEKFKQATTEFKKKNGLR